MCIWSQEYDGGLEFYKVVDMACAFHGKSHPSDLMHCHASVIVNNRFSWHGGEHTVGVQLPTKHHISA